ncbi:hypothetical protein R3W88_033025 [Solanum pinnatisectum]|uniref:Reverse transcriptase zinc-binding domain-containing protein n=1 Tax=Solanum pinnatisectum TaxID=50273 RepID=A0AAV9K2M4_9SOLN|nr:hypothetical protein R3W88_033025 [Solanum pinnatisectum]
MHHNRLPTSQYLHRIGLSVSPNYHIYGHHLEDIDHIFFSCTNAKDFWRTIICNNTSIHKLSNDFLNHGTWRNSWKDIKGKSYNHHLQRDTILPFCL